MSATPALEVVEPGLLLTVQDLGRPGHEHLGVPRSGAADPTSLAWANDVVGNPAGAAGLEATLLGPRLRALRDVVVGIAGAHLEPAIEPGGRPVDVHRPVRLTRGDELTFGEAGDPERGCRVYIATAGGIDVPLILGSRSTSLVGAFGGFEGRALRARDILEAFVLPLADPAESDSGTLLRSAARPIGVLAGPAALEPGGEGQFATLLGRPWRVSLDSDRRGLRLEPLDGSSPPPGPSADRPSQGVVVGTIQLTPSGQPVVLMPDGGTTGGYPVIAIVRSADLARLGQLAPGAEIRFTEARVGFGE